MQAAQVMGGSSIVVLALFLRLDMFFSFSCTISIIVIILIITIIHHFLKKVLQVGLPTRVRYDDPGFMAMAAALDHDTRALFEPTPSSTSTSTSTSHVVHPWSLVAALLWAFDVPPDSYRLGNTRAFFKSGQGSAVIFEMLETKMDEQVTTSRSASFV